MPDPVQETSVEVICNKTWLANIRTEMASKFEVSLLTHVTENAAVLTAGAGSTVYSLGCVLVEPCLSDF